MRDKELTPFPLDGGRAGDGGDGSTAATPQKKAGRAISAPEWAPKKAHAAHATARARRLRQDMTVREDWLKAQGYRVLRFTDREVENDIAAVVGRIAAELSPPSPALPPSRGKGED